jgi:predicted O-linked N-acetylglucosamine transferase (SPINDLY family)
MLRGAVVTATFHGGGGTVSCTIRPRLIEALVRAPVMASGEDTLRQARAALASGQAPRAAQLCARMLDVEPSHIEVRHMHGRCLAALGRWNDAIAEFRRALSMRPAYYPALVDLGIALASVGEFVDARQTLEVALGLDSRPPELHFGLGLCALGLDRIPDAIASFSQAVKRRPGFVPAHTNLGDAYLRHGEPAAAAAAYARAAGLSPSDAGLQADWGAALLAAKDFSAAAATLERALDLDPHLARAAANLGAALRHMGRLDAAASAYARALAVQPDLVEAHAGLGTIAAAQGRFAAALQHHTHAIDLDPTRLPALVDFARGLEAAGRYPEALSALERARQYSPSDAEANAVLASCAFRICDWDRLADALRHLRAGQSLDRLHPFLTLAADLDPTESAQLLRRHARKLPQAPRPASRHAHARLRVAYVSPDFREHAVAHALAGVIDSHDRQRILPLAFALLPPDASTVARRLQTAFDEFNDVSSMTDAGVAQLMRDREIDVAVDLAGYTVGSRPGIFAQRAAYAQVNYLGFPGSSGADYMDFIVGDRIVIPAADEALYTERVLRLPDCYLPFDCSRTGIDRSSRAAAGLPDDAVVLCAFSNAYKITRGLFELWMDVLVHVPRGVLWLRSVDPTAQANLQARARAAGVASERLIFAPHVASMAAHLGRLRCADVFLDTRPYNAHTTALEALWAGVPVVTCPTVGRFAGRVGASVLAAAGLDEWICADLDAYRTRTLALAQSPDLRHAVREKIALARLSAPAFDTARYTRAWESALWTAWESLA